MRVPTADKLHKAFPELTDSQIKLIRALGHAAEMPKRDAYGYPIDDKLEKLVEAHLPRTAQYVRSMHSGPFRSSIWRVTMALAGMDEILGTYGVEGLGTPRSGDYAPPYEYLNAGDPYETTLIYRRSSDSLHIGSWGDIAERLSS